MSRDALEVCREALRMASEAGARISFDPNMRPELLPPDRAREAFAPFIKAADILLPTADELLLLTGEATEADAVGLLLREKPGRIIAVTRGAEGCSVYAENQAVDAPGFAVDEIDPTGAGDCFDAGFLTALLEGMALDEAARLANACGALAVTEKGPMAGAKSRAEVEEFIASNERA